MSSPVAVCLFVVELLRVLCRYKVVDDLDGVVQELSELVRRHQPGNRRRRKVRLREISRNSASSAREVS